MFAMFRAQGEDKENEESKAEEAPKEMSLEEWKELQEKERAKATFELRKAGEGEKKGMWKDTKVLKKPVEEEGEYGARRVSEHHLVRVWRNRGKEWLKDLTYVCWDILSTLCLVQLEMCECIMEDCHFLLKYCCSNICYSFLRSLKSKKRHLVVSSKQLTYLLILK